MKAVVMLFEKTDLETRGQTHATLVRQSRVEIEVPNALGDAIRQINPDRDALQTTAFAKVPDQVPAET